MKIGITYTGTEEKHMNYVRWLGNETGVETICFSQGQIEPGAIQQCDGLLLSGGRDIHPRFYKSKNLHYRHAPDSFDAARDQFELDVYREAEKKGLPVLAICRGFQLLNCLLGGTLRQDLGIVKNAIHRAEQSNDKAHGLHIVEGTVLAAISNASHLVVNSAHHQAIQQVGNGLKINAYSDDGVPEGFEWAEKKGKPFLLGLQWHPERMFRFLLQDSPLSSRVRALFLTEVKTQKEKNENC